VRRSQVAVKLFNALSNNLPAFHIEASMLSQLHNEHIVELFAWANHARGPCMVIALADNGSLHNVVHGMRHPHVLHVAQHIRRYTTD
jgi:hypothetical protein